MPELTGNPAEALRARAEAARPRGALLRWDASGRALLVSDAPRRGGTIALPDDISLEEDGMLWIDLPADAYAALLGQNFVRNGAWDDEWWAAQSLLTGILRRDPCPVDGPADIPLLRAAMIACARGEGHVRPFLTSLRAADAQALRARRDATVRACAALAARWLWTARGIGLPSISRLSR